MRKVIMVPVFLAIIVVAYGLSAEAGYVRHGVQKADHGVKKGATETSTGVKKGWHATEKGVGKGASATSGGVKKGWHATGRFFKKVF